MIPIDKIEKGQAWGLIKINRGDIIVSHVNKYNNTIYWYYDGHEGNVMDSPYEKFVQDFFPRDESIIEAPKPERKSARDDLDLLL